MSENIRNYFLENFRSNPGKFYELMADNDVEKSEACNPDDFASIKEVLEMGLG